VRLRLTLLFGGLFLVAGAALLAITYGLVSHATGQIFIQQSAGLGESLPALNVQQLQAVAQQNIAGTKAAENDALLLYSGIALAIMAAVSVALGWFAAGRALRPLRRITAAAQRISATSLRERLAIDGPADDLRELADTIDGLFARLDASLDAQRQFVANASHELRTPLARSRTLLEVALRHPDAEPACSAQVLRIACERAVVAADEQERLIEALLTLARGQRGLARRDPVDLAAVTHDVLRARGAEITARGLTMAVTLQPALLAGDAALTERAVANLIDNAIWHNCPDGKVWISVSAAGQDTDGPGQDTDGPGQDTDGPGQDTDGAGAVLTVANTGPRVPPGDIPRLLQPFQRRVAGRAGPRTAEHGGPHGGVGLGLPIAQAVAQAHGATLSLTPREGGGLMAKLAFSLASHRRETRVSDDTRVPVT